MVRIYLKREPARESLEGRLAGMRAALSAGTPQGGEANAKDLTGEHILAVSPVEAYDLTLGTGGPADWIRVFIEYGDLNRVEYHFLFSSPLLVLHSRISPRSRWQNACLTERCDSKMRIPLDLREAGSTP